MSHEGRSAFDNRTDEEKQRSYEHGLDSRARDELRKKGKYSNFHATSSEFWEREHKVDEAKELLRDKDKYEEIKCRRGW